MTRRSPESIARDYLGRDQLDLADPHATRTDGATGYCGRPDSSVTAR